MSADLSVSVLGLGPLQANCTVLSQGGVAVVIDPGGDVAELRAHLRERALAVAGIVLTHGHIDHVAGAADLQAQLAADGGAPVPIYLHRDDQELYRNAGAQARMFGLPGVQVAQDTRDLADGQTLALGPIALEVLHTPGHSPGSVSLFHRPSRLLVCGDVLFAGSIGRSDLWGGDHAALLRSIRDRLLPLGDEVQVITGHGPETTLGAERRHNPFLNGML